MVCTDRGWNSQVCLLLPFNIFVYCKIVKNTDHPRSTKKLGCPSRLTPVISFMQQTPQLMNGNQLRVRSRNLEVKSSDDFIKRTVQINFSMILPKKCKSEGTRKSWCPNLRCCWVCQPQWYYEVSWPRSPEWIQTQILWALPVPTAKWSWFWATRRQSEIMEFTWIYIYHRPKEIHQHRLNLASWRAHFLQNSRLFEMSVWN